jgi:hypothetical protein
MELNRNAFRLSSRRYGRLYFCVAVASSPFGAPKGSVVRASKQKWWTLVLTKQDSTRSAGPRRSRAQMRRRVESSCRRRAASEWQRYRPRAKWPTHRRIRVCQVSAPWLRQKYRFLGRIVVTTSMAPTVSRDESATSGRSAKPHPERLLQQLHDYPRRGSKFEVALDRR